VSGPKPTSVPAGPRSAEEVVIAIALTTTWALVTGRRPRAGLPLFHDLPAHELIGFWADDHLAPRPEIPSGLPEQAAHDPRISPVRHHVA
jgi:hypothetical protein